MRPILQGDLIMAARAVLLLAPSARFGAMRRMLEEAHCADRIRKRLGRSHPLWGNGALIDRAMRVPLYRGSLFGPEYLQALALVLAVIAEWRARV